MISGDQLLTDVKLVRRLAKAAGISDKRVDQLSSQDVSNLMLLIATAHYHLVVCSQVEFENIIILQDCYSQGSPDIR